MLFLLGSLGVFLDFLVAQLFHRAPMPLSSFMRMLASLFAGVVYIIVQNDLTE